MNDIEVQSEFVEELRQLLKKYKVDMSIDTLDEAIEFWAYAQYDLDNNLISEHIDYKTKGLYWSDVE